MDSDDFYAQRFVRSDVIEVTGVPAFDLGNWLTRPLNRGGLTIEPGWNPGRGNKRLFSPAHMVKVRLAMEFSAIGITGVHLNGIITADETNAWIEDARRHHASADDVPVEHLIIVTRTKESTFADYARLSEGADFWRDVFEGGKPPLAFSLVQLGAIVLETTHGVRALEVARRDPAERSPEDRTILQMAAARRRENVPAGYVDRSAVEALVEAVKDDLAALPAKATERLRAKAAKAKAPDDDLTTIVRDMAAKVDALWRKHVDDKPDPASKD